MDSTAPSRAAPHTSSPPTPAVRSSTWLAEVNFRAENGLRAVQRIGILPPLQGPGQSRLSPRHSGTIPVRARSPETQAPGVKGKGSASPRLLSQREPPALTLVV